MRGSRLRTALLLAFLAASAAARADLYAPNRPLRTLSTEWFDITFPEDARAQAERLASFADDAYRKVAGYFGTEPRLRFPVILSPDTASVEGWYSVWPSRRIVLFPAPMDPNDGLGYQTDDLRAVFLHELAHAVSLTIRPHIWDVAAAVFGDAAGISYYTTPINLIEGAAISAEGLDGRGRAADPLTADDLRQDIREGRFKSFWESAGAWDRYPWGRTPYSYGALFTRYLLEVYGPESYRELWRRMGEGLVLPGLGDAAFVPGVFRRVYGLPLSEAWRDFAKWMAPAAPASEVEKLTPPGLITAIAARDALVYRADGAARRIFALDAASGAGAGAWPGDASISRMSVSPDGRSLLVSHSRDAKGASEAVLRVLDLETGASRRLPHQGLRDAAWTGDLGIAAVRASGTGASLVLIRDGVEQLLLPGGPSVSYASPCPSAEGWIYALRRADGETSVVRLGPKDSAVPGSAGPQTERLVLPAGFAAVRDLSLDEAGTLRFSWHDGETYRPAEVRGGVLRYAAEGRSGGVRGAVSAGGRIFYLGSFSEGTALCELPWETGWTETPALWIPEDAAIPDPSASDASDGAEAGSGAEAAASRPYSLLPGLVPGVRYPAFRFSSDGLWALGAGIAGGDVAETFSYEAGALWIPGLRAADLLLSLRISAFAPTLTLSFEDEFDADGSGTTRTTRAGLSVERSLSVYGGGVLSAGASAEALWFGFAAAGGDPYGPRDAAVAAGTLSVSCGRWAFDVRKPAALRGAEAGLTAFGAGVLPPGASETLAGLEGAFRVRTIRPNLALEAYGAASLAPGLAYGPEGRSFAGFRSGATYPEYAVWAGSQAGPWYAYADASISPAVLEIQGRLGPIHLQRLILTGGGRAAFTSGAFVGSAYARLSLDFAPLLGAYARLRPRAWIEAEYAPDPDRMRVGWLIELPY